MNIVYMVAVLVAGGMDGAGISVVRVTVRPAGREGFDVLAGGRLSAPIRLSTNGAITAETVETQSGGVRLSRLVCKDPRASRSRRTISAQCRASLGRGAGSTVPAEGPEFRRRAMAGPVPRGAGPVPLLSCSLPKAQVWHQRGWLNATPHADPFPLLQDVHTGSPELSCTWNRNWSEGHRRNLPVDAALCLDPK